jgi:hypothetical protein
LAIPSNPGFQFNDMTPLELRKVLKKNGIDSPKTGRKNLTSTKAVELLKEAGKLPATNEPPAMPSITATLFFALPRFILGLPLRLFASKKVEAKEE